VPRRRDPAARPARDLSEPATQTDRAVRGPDECLAGPEELAPGLPYREFLREALRHRTEGEFRASAWFRRYGEALDRLSRTPRIAWRVDPEAPHGADTYGAPAYGVAAGAAAADSVAAYSVAAGAAAADGAAAEAPTSAGAAVLYASPSPRPARTSVRIAQWNIEKGRELPGIIAKLRDDPWLREAHIVCLNEVDDGTARGGNVDQARELGRALGLTAVFLPCWVECTRGVGPDLEIPGEHRRGLQGIAILSRLPVRAAAACVLPACFDAFDFHEKRYGGRRGLFVRLDWGGWPLIVGTTHLEVRNTPRCRAEQIGAFLGGLRQFLEGSAGASVAAGAPGGAVPAAQVPGHGPPDPSAGPRGLEAAGRALPLEAVPVLLAGDWNTSSFHRGTLAGSAREFFRILLRSPEELDRELAWPVAREPLFARLAAEGFSVDRWNEAAPTARQDLGRVEDLDRLNPWLARRLDRLAGLSGRTLHMRLDWVAARGLRLAGRPVTIPPSGPDGRTLSDHAVVGVDVV